MGTPRLESRETTPPAPRRCCSSCRCCSERRNGRPSDYCQTNRPARRLSRPYKRAPMGHCLPFEYNTEKRKRHLFAKSNKDAYSAKKFGRLPAAIDGGSAAGNPLGAHTPSPEDQRVQSYESEIRGQRIQRAEGQLPEDHATRTPTELSQKTLRPERRNGRPPDNRQTNRPARRDCRHLPGCYRP